jgi:hypothetical protein
VFEVAGNVSSDSAGRGVRCHHSQLDRANSPSVPAISRYFSFPDESLTDPLPPHIEQVCFIVINPPSPHSSPESQKQAEENKEAMPSSRWKEMLSLTLTSVRHPAFRKSA